MNYDEARDSEQLRKLDDAIGEFIIRYNRNQTTNPRKTLILFPGGMGSRLIQATAAFDQASGSVPPFNYDTIWLDVGTFFGDVFCLEMTRDQQGTYRDWNDRIVVADGETNLLGLTVYSDFTRWCNDNGVDWFIYNYDWRRPLKDVVDFFLQTFLPHFQQTVGNGPNGGDPLNDFVLVGHSLGGMVIKLILNSSDPQLATMSSAITVGSPFYGYGEQMHRYFEGESYFNYLGTKAVIKMISSLPGPYAFCYLDANTHQTHQVKLQTDPQYPLARYPSKDQPVPATSVDPYNPGQNRYPTNLGFDPVKLQAGLQTYVKIGNAVPNAQLAARFYNIRGVKVGGNTTEGGVTWAAVPSTYNPAAGSPLADDPQMVVPGDGTQPAWTTRLVTQPDPNCIVVKLEFLFDHMVMMASPKVQSEIAKILWPPPAARMMVKGQPSTGKPKRRKAKRPQIVAPASVKEAHDFIQKLHEIRAKSGVEGVERYIKRQRLDSLQAIGRRIISDVMKGPSPERLALREEKDGGKGGGKKSDAPARKASKKKAAKPKAKSGAKPKAKSGAKPKAKSGAKPKKGASRSKPTRKTPKR